MPEVTGRLRTPRLATAPASPVVGEMYYDTTTNGLYFWDGTSWVSTRSAAGTIYDSDPIGTVKGWSGKTVPTNWKLADGATYTKASFPQGWDFAKAEKDAGNNLWAYTATDFTVPNFTDRFILAPGATRPIGTRSQTNPAVAFPGEETHTLLAAESGVNGSGATGNDAPDHSHGYVYNDIYATVDGGSSANVSTAYGIGQTQGANTRHTHGLTARNADATHNNMPPYVVVAMIVKVAGAAIDSGGALVGPPGPTGAASTVPGPTGPTGPAGQGVPVGGTTGQVLNKKTATDYDTQWSAPTGGSGLPEIYVGPEPPARNAEVIWIDTDASPAGSLNWVLDGWHTIGNPGEPAFQGGWASYDNAVTYAAPGFRKDSGGRVALRGLIKNGTIAGPIFTLPVGYRPTRELLFAPSNNSNATTDVRVRADGTVYCQAGLNTWLTLDGIEFDTESVQSVASLAAQPLDAVHVVGAAGEPAFTGSWVNSGGALPVARFRKYPDGRVRLEGQIKGGTINTTPCFTLPVGYRPPTNIYIPTVSAGAFGRLLIQSDGLVYPATGSSADFSLSGAEFDTETQTTYATGTLPGPDSYYVRANLSGSVGAGAFLTTNLALAAQGGDGGAFTVSGTTITARDAGTYLVTVRPGSPAANTRWYSRIMYGPAAAQAGLQPVDTATLPGGAGIGLVFANTGVVRLLAGETVSIAVFSMVAGAVGGEVEVTRLIQGAQGPQGPVSATYVTVLPSSPTDGQEVFLRVDQAGTYGGPYLWHCRYSAVLSGTSKWEVLAGPALRIEGIGGRSWLTQEATTSTTYTTLATAGPTIPIPVAGVYEMEGKATGSAGGAGTLVGILMAVSGEGVPTWQSADAATVPTADGYGSTLFGRRTRAITAGLSVSLLYATSNASYQARFYDRALYLRPVRIG